MKACSLVTLIFGTVTLLVTPGLAQNDFGDIGKELPVVTAKSPVDSQAMLKVVDGFRMELVAAEPLVHDPVAVAFDEDGRMYVVELPPYNSYVVDGFATKGSIRVLEDTDDDGVYDKSVLFASGLSYPTAIACWDGGVFVGDAPGQSGRSSSEFNSMGARSSVSSVDKPQWRQREGCRAGGG